MMYGICKEAREMKNKNLDLQIMVKKTQGIKMPELKKQIESKEMEVSLVKDMVRSLQANLK